MAPRKNPKRRRPKRAFVVTVKVPRGTKGRALVKKIADELLAVPTDVFEAGDMIVVSREYEGEKPRPKKKS